MNTGSAIAGVSALKAQAVRALVSKKMANEPKPLGDDAGQVESRYEAGRLHLARLNVEECGSLRRALREVTNVAADVLRVNRVSIWIFLNERRSIRCEFLYQPFVDEDYEGMILHAEDFPGYFRALEMKRTIPVTDTDGDQLVSEFREPYFRPLGITSMLDAPIYHGGELCGIVCHEQVGPLRKWSELECEFAGSVAEVIARLKEESARVQAERALGSYQAHAAELQRMGTLGRLAAGIAHDFNNVLSSIIGYGDLLTQETVEMPGLQTMVKELMVAAQHGASLTRELMTLGRAVPNKPCVADVSELLAKSARLFRVAAGTTATVEIRTPSDVSQVFIDPAQFERAILNLVVNARDAMQTGGQITIDLSEGRRRRVPQDEAIYVIIAVSDTGKGMDAATCAQIFEPFFTTKGKRGNGLGLAIVNQIVAFGGGFVEVESAVGQGATFRIYLPRVARPRQGTGGMPM